MPDFDMGEEIAREAFLESNPDLRRCEIFLALMAQMDFREAEVFLRGEDADADDEGGGSGPLNPDVMSPEGFAALHVSALNDDVEGVKLLLEYGADKGLVTGDGMTALDLARSQGAERVVALLSS